MFIILKKECFVLVYKRVGKKMMFQQFRFQEIDDPPVALWNP